jgi:hypothetical protein
LCLQQGWVEQHAKVHNSIIKGNRPPRFLVLQPECGYCGMCNRLNSILGTYLLAVLLERALVIDWTWKGRGGVKEDSRYFEPRVIDWTAKTAVGTPYFDYDEKRTK